MTRHTNDRLPADDATGSPPGHHSHDRTSDRLPQMAPTTFLPATRRAFLETAAWRCTALCLGIAGAGALGACASVVARPVTAVDGKIRLPLIQHPELTRPGESLRIQPSGLANPLYILVVAPRTFTVVSPICTHLGCTVDVTGDRLVCPCHGSTYDWEGRVLRGPAERPLARFATSMEGENILVIDLAQEQHA